MRPSLASIRTLFVSSATLIALATPAFSTVITIPDGGFNSTTNVGSIGGGLVSGSASNQAIGSSGPWLGNYVAAAGLLTPPTLSISSSTNTATISGVAGINVLGLVNNGGDFTTTLTNAGSGANFAYMQNTTYTLTATISASTTLALSALTTDGVGIALTNNGVIVASTATAPSLLTLLSGNTYQLSLTYAIGATGGPTGNAIGIELYDLPSNLLTANLLSNVSFSNVALASTATPEPAAFILSAAGLLGLGLFEYRRRRSTVRS